MAVKRSNTAAQLSKEQIAEIVAESRIMQKFKHPNIVRLWGVAGSFIAFMPCTLMSSSDTLHPVPK